MLDIHDKCNMLTLMTAAPFQVTLVPSESSDLSPSGDKIKAFVLYHYDDFKTSNNLLSNNNTVFLPQVITLGLFSESFLCKRIAL